MTTQTLKNFIPERVRNVSENPESVIAMPTSKDTLLQILTILDAMVEYTDKQDLYGDVARRLSTIAKKEPVWQWRYVLSVANGKVEPGKKFARAIEVLAVSLDGIPVPFANASPVTVYAETGTIKDGSLVMLGSVRCANPTCTVEFVPNVPWRKLCPLCSPIRSKDVQ